MHCCTQPQRYLQALPDHQRRKFEQRLERFAKGQVGEVHACWTTGGLRIFEMRIFARPGLRAYYTVIDGVHVLLRCGTKRTQKSDISLAAKELRGMEGKTANHF